MLRRKCSRQAASLPLGILFAFLVLVGAPRVGLAREGAQGGESRGPALATLRLDDSIPDELRTRFGDIQREVRRLQVAGRSAEAARMASQLERFVDQANGRLQPLSDGKAELHFVGLYAGGFPAGKPPGQHPQGVAEVEVQFTGQPLVLALCACEPVKWKVHLADGVKIKQIVLAGYYAQEIEGLTKDVAVVDESGGKTRRRFFAYSKSDLHGYMQAALRLKEITGLEPATFQGGEKYTGSPVVIGEKNAEWRRQLLETRMTPLHRAATLYQREQQRQRMQAVRFQAVHYSAANAQQARYRDFQGQLAQFTPSGPVATTMQPLPGRLSHVAVDPKGPTYYAIQGHGVVKVDLASSAAKEMKIAEDLPRLSWPCGLAFDTKRRRLVVTSLGGEGFVYAYDVQQDRWSLVVSMNNIDVQCLTYSAENDVFYALKQNHSGKLHELLVIDAQGKLLREVKLQELLYAEQLGPDGRFQIVGVGRHVVIVTPPAPDLDAEGYPLHSRCCLFDPKSGKLLYKDVSQPHADARRFRGEELEAIWEQLLTDDDNQAELLIWRMAAGGGQAVDFVRARILPPPQVDQRRIAELIKQLDDDQFEVRKAASKKLAEMGDLAAGELTRAVERPRSKEQQLRLQQLLSAIEAGTPSSPEMRRELRAVRMLGRCEAPEAVDYLKQLAQQRAGSIRSRAAEQSLRRLEARRTP